MRASDLERIFRECRLEKRQYPRLRDWLLRLYDRALNRWPAAPLPFRKKICEVYARDVAEPFFFRLGSSDWQVWNEIFLHEEYEVLLKHNIGRPRVIVDLGSNIGLSLRIWQQHYPEARILAVEPDADNAMLLRRNVPEAASGQVMLEEACVLGHVRPVRLQAGAGEWAYSVTELTGESRSADIPAFTMPQLLERHGLDGPIDLLKCDIEGTEAELFRDCGSWLSRVRFGMVELHGNYRPNDFERDTRASGVPVEIVESEERSDLSLILFQAATGDSCTPSPDDGRSAEPTTG